MAPDLSLGVVSPTRCQLLSANFSIHLGMVGQCGFSPVDTPFTERDRMERRKLGGKVGNQRGSCFFPSSVTMGVLKRGTPLGLRRGHWGEVPSFSGLQVEVEKRWI